MHWQTQWNMAAPKVGGGIFWRGVNVPSLGDIYKCGETRSNKTLSRLEFTRRQFNLKDHD
jgi:hypothetical protein